MFIHICSIFRQGRWTPWKLFYAESKGLNLMFSGNVFHSWGATLQNVRSPCLTKLAETTDSMSLLYDLRESCGLVAGKGRRVHRYTLSLVNTDIYEAQQCSLIAELDKRVDLKHEKKQKYFIYNILPFISNIIIT